MSKPQLRKTKIVATIGPASDAPEVLRAMIQAGMNVARLNLSLGTHEEHKARLERIREAAEAVDTNVAIMIDTRGIEIRTGKVRGGAVEVLRGDSFTLYTDKRVGDASGVSVSYKGLPAEVSPGVAILLDDGAIELKVVGTDTGQVVCSVIHGGVLRDTKSVNLPNTELSVSAVSPENRDDVVKELTFAAENEVDYIAASFVQSAEDILRMREILSERGVRIPIIAKIENKRGLANLPEIVDVADGIMVARGDLGVELPLADIPATQKKIIRTTVGNGKPVITATQMLASMERNPKPTRAEASDVANAILDGTSAVMLSGETAAGNFPIESVRTMSTLALRTESSLREYGYLQKIMPHTANPVTDAVSEAATTIALNLKAAAIVTLTSTGFTSRMVSRHRPDCPILAITGARTVARLLSMNWGVIPLLYGGDPSDDAKIEFAVDRARQLGYVGAGDVLVVTAGHRQQAGGTDLIRVISLDA